MNDDTSSQPIRVACDAMCGGLARWLRALGVDASYTPGIDDSDLVAHAQTEGRLVVSSDHKLFERRVFTMHELPGLLMPVGLRLREQLRFTVRELALTVGFPRCTLCNGELAPVRRAEVGDVVPARSLVWARTFYQCQGCGHVFWEGTHWRRIGAVRSAMQAIADDDPPT
ncbi:MAG: Mut7-C RNAse domain-containing protein [Phycisphaerae bacterium]